MAPAKVTTINTLGAYSKRGEHLTIKNTPAVHECYSLPFGPQDLRYATPVRIPTCWIHGPLVSIRRDGSFLEGGTLELPGGSDYTFNFVQPRKLHSPHSDSSIVDTDIVIGIVILQTTVTNRFDIILLHSIRTGVIQMIRGGPGTRGEPRPFGGAPRSTIHDLRSTTRSCPDPDRPGPKGRDDGRDVEGGPVGTQGPIRIGIFPVRTRRDRDPSFRRTEDPIPDQNALLPYEI